jgi:DNA-binding response OmpR family regulator
LPSLAHPAENGWVAVLNKEILVVDDDPEARALVRKALETLGSFVVEVGSVAEAREHLKQSLPHAIVTDLTMPGEDGFALIESVRAVRSKKALPIMVLSGKHDKEAIFRATSLGADEYMTKPFAVSQLLQKLKRMLKDRDFLKRTFPAGAEPSLNAVVAINVRSLNEISAVIEARVKLATGVSLELDAAAFRDLGLSEVPMKRTSYPGVLTETGAYANSITFVGVSETLAQSVRKSVRTWVRPDAK